MNSIKQDQDEYEIDKRSLREHEHENEDEHVLIVANRLDGFRVSVGQA